MAVEVVCLIISSSKDLSSRVFFSKFFLPCNRTKAYISFLHLLIFFSSFFLDDFTSCYTDIMSNKAIPKFLISLFSDLTALICPSCLLHPFTYSFHQLAIFMSPFLSYFSYPIPPWYVVFIRIHVVFIVILSKFPRNCFSFPLALALLTVR